MAAVLTPRTEIAPWNEPASLPRRPRLRLVEGGRSRAPDFAPTDFAPLYVTPGRVAWPRPSFPTVVGGVVLAVIVSLAAFGAVRVLGADAAASGPASTATSPHPAGADASTSAAPAAVVVQPGDTLWAIARRLQPSGDVRPLVDRLAERAGGAGVEAGQRIDISGLFG